MPLHADKISRYNFKTGTLTPISEPLQAAIVQIYMIRSKDLLERPLRPRTGYDAKRNVKLVCDCLKFNQEPSYRFVVRPNLERCLILAHRIVAVAGILQGNAMVESRGRIVW